MLLFVFVGVLLLRLATRTLVALLFQEPPRSTREPRLGTSWAFRKETAESITLLKIYSERRKTVCEKIARRSP